MQIFDVITVMVWGGFMKRNMLLFIEYIISDLFMIMGQPERQSRNIFEQNAALWRKLPVHNSPIGAEWLLTRK